jgi:2,4-dienoyl-CoA reductase-like NADH-dependent reductase (Old Yellow Enzyme family)
LRQGRRAFYKVNLHPQVSHPMTSSLFSPLSLAGLTLPNRVVVAPMCQYSADDGVASDWHITHLGMLANSGAAMVIAEATGVERHGRITHGCLGLYSDACEDALAHVVRHCKRIGTARFGIQLGHAGRKASAQLPWKGGHALKADEDPWQTVAPSAIPFGQGWHTPRAATRADMDRIRDAFVAAAKRALAIGFDEIELHMAHGYLLHSFMSPISNTRDDEYGGSLENRLRFPLEVTKAVRAVVPKDVPLGARITGNDWTEGGLTPNDAVSIAKALKAAGIEFLCVSSGGVTFETKVPVGPGYQVPFAEKVKREAGIMTRAVGLIVTPEQAESVIAEGRADMVAIARAVLDDPHWGWHAGEILGADVPRPVQYARITPKQWPGAAMVRPVNS